MRLFDMRTTVDTSNRSLCRFQTTTTPRLQSLLRASIVELLSSVLFQITIYLLDRLAQVKCQS